MRTLLLLPALLLSSVLLVVGAPTHAQGSGSPTPVRSGPIEGRWDLPDSSGPGHFVGHLLGRSGKPLFRIQGAVIPDRAPRPRGDGDLIGRAVLLVGPSAGAEFELRGRWDLDRPGRGNFHGVLLAPRASSQAPKPLLRLNGRFEDLPLAPRPGHFDGRWSEPR